MSSTPQHGGFFKIGKDQKEEKDVEDGGSNGFLSYLEQLRQGLDVGNRYDTYFYKRFFWGAVVFLSIIALVILAQYDFNIMEERAYVYCPSDARGGKCLNPLYEKSCDKPYCNVEYLQAGESFGERPSYLYKNFGSIAVYTILFAFIFNHLWYRRRVRKGEIEPVEVPDLKIQEDEEG